MLHGHSGSLGSSSADRSAGKLAWTGAELGCGGRASGALISLMNAAVMRIIWVPERDGSAVQQQGAATKADLHLTFTGPI